MANFSTTIVNKNQVVQAAHTGLNFAFAQFSSSGNKTPFSRSVSDTIFVMNLPRNARVIQAWLGGMVQDGNAGFSLGDANSTTRYGTKSVSATSINQVAFDVPMGVINSVSDDQNFYPLLLTLQNTTSVSGSMSVHVGVLWQKV